MTGKIKDLTVKEEFGPEIELSANWVKDRPKLKRHYENT